MTEVHRFVPPLTCFYGRRGTARCAKCGVIAEFITFGGERRLFYVVNEILVDEAPACAIRHYVVPIRERPVLLDPARGTG